MSIAWLCIIIWNWSFKSKEIKSLSSVLPIWILLLFSLSPRPPGHPTFTSSHYTVWDEESAVYLSALIQCCSCLQVRRRTFDTHSSHVSAVLDQTHTHLFILTRTCLSFTIQHTFCCRGSWETSKMGSPSKVHSAVPCWDCPCPSVSEQAAASSFIFHILTLSGTKIRTNICFSINPFPTT